MQSYVKNRNNYFENLIGECYCLKMANPIIKIIPVNIIKYITVNNNCANSTRYTYTKEEFDK